ncbi:hypothetical protein GGTG_05269 [Gaeumannomyces tritici R3-111a-1]|uniref:Uncharacterized protein n=1 Tax=Gaeumannomyces tritici (strain R3-111a-1) TaxID=644352 RepID=J3NVF4_GAET3|nr:hypothetical protein GGTG_05269 [Gaeumannomyces tritici R3-111a-1]EJT75332.1 hypothetical protein GGTG_05269 [Gaeumannomyces tritici R3-111a-1]
MLFFSVLLTIRFVIINLIAFKINNNKAISFYFPLVIIVALANFAITVAPGNLAVLNNPFGKFGKKWFGKLILLMLNVLVNRFKKNLVNKISVNWLANLINCCINLSVFLFIILALCIFPKKPLLPPQPRDGKTPLNTANLTLNLNFSLPARYRTGGAVTDRPKASNNTTITNAPNPFPTRTRIVNLKNQLIKILKLFVLFGNTELMFKIQLVCRKAVKPAITRLRSALTHFLIPAPPPPKYISARTERKITILTKNAFFKIANRIPVKIIIILIKKFGNNVKATRKFFNGNPKPYAITVLYLKAKFLTLNRLQREQKPFNVINVTAGTQLARKPFKTVLITIITPESLLKIYLIYFLNPKASPN